MYWSNHAKNRTNLSETTHIVYNPQPNIPTIKTVTYLTNIICSIHCLSHETNKSNIHEIPNTVYLLKSLFNGQMYPKSTQ